MVPKTHNGKDGFSGISYFDKLHVDTLCCRGAATATIHSMYGSDAHRGYN